MSKISQTYEEYIEDRVRDAESFLKQHCEHKEDDEFVYCEDDTYFYIIFNVSIQTQFERVLVGRTHNIDPNMDIENMSINMSINDIINSLYFVNTVVRIHKTTGEVAYTAQTE